MATDHEAWLKLTVEDAIEPDLPICDSHQHFWHHPDQPAQPYRPDSRYLLEDLLRDTGGGHRIVQTVFVECTSMYRKGGAEEMRPVGETEFVQGIAAQSASGQYGTTRAAAGIVGHADLTLGAAVAAVLEAHIAASSNRFRGIRHPSAWHANASLRSYKSPPEGLLLDAKFREGFACLQKYGLSFDAGLYHTQLMELVDLSRAFPEITIIVNHIGCPINTGPYAGKQGEVFEEWKRGITALAGCPRVFMKLGGLGMGIFGFGWHQRATPPGSAEMAEAMAPYYLWCIEQFGADRCMFESNFPVDRMAYSYTVMWNAFKRVSEGFSPEQRRDLLHDTAARAYRLPTSDQGLI